MTGLPITLDAQRARVLVVGGGSAAVRAAESAGAAGATVRVVDPDSGTATRDLEARFRSITVEVRAPGPADVAWATVVYAASDDRALNTRVGELAQAAGRLVSVSGDRAASTFLTPVVTHAGALTVAVSAGDLEPMAWRVAEMVGERVGPAYAAAMDGLMALRARLLARGDAERWADAMAALLDEDVCRSIERGLFARRLAAWE